MMLPGLLAVGLRGITLLADELRDEARTTARQMERERRRVP